MTDIFSRNKRQFLLGLLAFFIGRVWVATMNPFGVALFVCACSEKRGRGWVLGGTVLGMMTVMQGPTLARYYLLLAVLWFVDYIRRRMRLRRQQKYVMAFVAGGVNLLMGIGASYLAYYGAQTWWMAVLESVGIVALSNVFQWGIGTILYGDSGQALCNEEFVSMTILVTLGLMGFPTWMDGIFSIQETIVYFLMLYVGCRYGASFGAIAGAAGGILAAVNQGNTVMIGLYCLLGIGIGMFRQAGRLLTSAMFLGMGAVLVYVFRDDVIGVVELRGIVSSIIIFMAIPKRYMAALTIETVGEEENPFAKEDIKVLANYKIEDFSGAFRKLSRSFSKTAVKQSTLSIHEMELISQELSERVCANCANCRYCWENHYEETANSVKQILLMACESGPIVEENIQRDFGRRCIHIEEYLDETNKQVVAAKMNLGWRNRMAESRKAVSTQMMEVASMLKDFTLELTDGKEAGKEEKKKVLLAFRRLGVQVKKLSIHTLRGGRLKVQFQARCRGKGCVTKNDIANGLKEVLGMAFAPGYETKHVLGNEFQQMCFIEDTKYKYLTGIARVAKTGEKVSGDNYSFLELADGELLMVLSDGMGSGEQACMESENLVEVLENLLEAGFQKESAVRLLNSFFVLSYGDNTFTTLDITAIDLYTGYCQMVKNGAAATFIRHNSQVETFSSGALPVGAALDVDSTKCKRKLYNGDMVVMVTDGIVDAFPGDSPEFYVENIIQNTKSSNPSDVANTILLQALERGTGEASDDMSVLVVGIWEKN